VNALFTLFDAIAITVFAGLYFQRLMPLLHPTPIPISASSKIVAASAATGALVAAYFYVLGRLGVADADVSQSFRAAGWSIGWVFVLIAVIPAIFEELAFRGIIQTSLETIVSPRDALIIQAAMFSVLHLLPFNFPSHFLLGLALGYARLQSKSLYAGMVIHGSWNSLVLLQEIYSTWL
jgi:hypothetical protein